MQTALWATGRSTVPERLDARRPLAPPGLHLDPQLEVHARVDQLLDLAPGPDADLLDLAPALPDRDPLLALALDDQVGADPHEVGTRLVVLLHLHRERVGELLLEQQG